MGGKQAEAGTLVRRWCSSTGGEVDHWAQAGSHGDGEKWATSGLYFERILAGFADWIRIRSVRRREESKTTAKFGLRSGRLQEEQVCWETARLWFWTC